MLFVLCNRVYFFSSTLHVLTQSSFHGRCILTLDYFVYVLESGIKKVLVLSGATDGKLAVWDVSDIIEFAMSAKCREMFQSKKIPATCEECERVTLSEPKLAIQVHQSGINCIATQQNSGFCTK